MVCRGRGWTDETYLHTSRRDICTLAEPYLHTPMLSCMGSIQATRGPIPIPTYPHKPTRWFGKGIPTYHTNLYPCIPYPPNARGPVARCSHLLHVIRTEYRFRSRIEDSCPASARYRSGRRSVLLPGWGALCEQIGLGGLINV